MTTISPTIPCRAKDPSTCKYHGAELRANSALAAGNWNAFQMASAEMFAARDIDEVSEFFAGHEVAPVTLANGLARELVEYEEHANVPGYTYEGATYGAGQRGVVKRQVVVRGNRDDKLYAISFEEPVDAFTAADPWGGKDPELVEVTAGYSFERRMMYTVMPDGQSVRVRANDLQDLLESEGSVVMRGQTFKYVTDTTEGIKDNEYVCNLIVEGSDGHLFETKFYLPVDREKRGYGNPFFADEVLLHEVSAREGGGQGTSTYTAVGSR